MANALDFFARLTEEDLNWFFAVGRERRLETGDALLVHGRRSEALFVVLSGGLAAFLPWSDEPLGTVDAGEVVGEVSYIDGRPASASVAALQPSTVLEVPFRLLDERAEGDPLFATRLYRALASMVCARKRGRDEAFPRSSASARVASVVATEEKRARVAAANIARLRGRMNHPNITLEDQHDYLSVIQDGLPPTTRPASIAVVGAGMAGLTAAYELGRAGHTVTVLEASRRAGGRCYTLRAPFAPGQYGEAGAMRFSSSHELLFAYIARFGLRTRRFAGDAPAGCFYLGGRKQRIVDVLADPGSPPNRIRALWGEAFEPITARYHKAQAEGGNAWPGLVAEYNEYTLRDFLVESGWSEDDIKALGTVGLGLGGWTSFMNISFVEVLRLALLGTDDDLHQIVGGTDRLTEAFLAQRSPAGTSSLRDVIRYGARVTGIAQEADCVRLRVDSPAGPFTLTADYAIVTVPFPMMRFIDVRPAFSPGKARAINELHYFSSTKIFLQCRTRFWENGPSAQRVGGATITDLPIRALYFPLPEPATDDGRGVILASYTWEEEARLWESLHPDDRIKEALRQVGLIYPQVLEEFEVGASVAWSDPDLFTGGAFAFYAPGQAGVLYEDIVAPEGRVHFAGEHTSFEHGWVEGAIESGLREAVALHRRTAPAMVLS